MSCQGGSDDHSMHSESTNHDFGHLVNDTESSASGCTSGSTNKETKNVVTVSSGACCSRADSSGKLQAPVTLPQMLTRFVSPAKSPQVWSGGTPPNTQVSCFSPLRNVAQSKSVLQLAEPQHSNQLGGVQGRGQGVGMSFKDRQRFFSVPNTSGCEVPPPLVNLITQLSQHPNSSSAGPKSNDSSSALYSRSVANCPIPNIAKDDRSAGMNSQISLCSPEKSSLQPVARRTSSGISFKDRQRLGGLGKCRSQSTCVSRRNSAVHFSGENKSVGQICMHNVPASSSVASPLKYTSEERKDQEPILVSDPLILPSFAVPHDTMPSVTSLVKDSNATSPTVMSSPFRNPRIATTTVSPACSSGDRHEKMLRRTSSLAHLPDATREEISGHSRQEVLPTGKLTQLLQERETGQSEGLVPLVHVREGHLVSAATRMSGRKSTFSSLLFSMLKMPRVHHVVPPSSAQLDFPQCGDTSCEAWDCSTMCDSLSNDYTDASFGNCNCSGVIETEEHVFIPVYESLHGKQSEMEVVLNSIRAACNCCETIALPEVPGAEKVRKLCSNHVAGGILGALNVSAERLAELGSSVSMSERDHSTSKNVDCFATDSCKLLTEDTEGFTFGVVSPAYATDPVDEAADVDCKVAARLLFDAENGVVIISAQEEVEKYISQPMCRVSANNVRNKTTDNAGDDSPLHDDSKKSSTGVFALSEPQRCAGVSREAEAMPSILSSESTLSGHFETDEAHSVGDESNYYEELGSVSRCRCSREVITRYARGVDYSRYHAHKLYHRCPYCGRRPAAFLCLHCLTATCPSHVTQHYNESTQAGRCCGSGKPLCRLFINILDITTSFDRVFWCESCRSFTWRYTEIYDPFVDQLAVTQGTYLQDPVRDIVCVGYEVQLKSPSQMQKLFSPSLHTSSVRDRSLLSLNPSPQGTALFIPPCTAPADPRAVSLVPGCSVNSLTESSKPNERGLSVTCSSQRRSVIQCAQFESDTVHVGVTTPKLVSLGAKVQGWRATQEDAETAFAIEIPALPSAPGRQMGQHVKGSLDEGTVGGGCDARSDTIVMAVFCVFDGHGGDAVAKLAASRFEAHLRKAVNSGKHNDIQARAVLRRLDLESTTPMLSMSDGSPRHIQESTTLSHAQFVEAVANMSSTFRGEEPGTPVEAQMTVEALRRHMEDYAANPHLAGLQATSTGGNSVTSHQGLSQVPSSLVSRHEMELLRLYFASVMEDALLSLDDELWRSAEGMRGDYNCVGCTACIVGITPNFVLCANVGDSGAAFYTPHTIRQISIAHRTTDPIEATRIAAAGYSLVGHRIEGLLAVPRALGDYDFKQCGGRSPQQQAVTAVPDVTIMPVSPQAAAGRWGVVVACDGVWDSATLHQVHHAIMNTPNDLDVATSATDAILRAKDMAPGLKGKKFCKSSGAIDNIVDSGNGGEPKASIDALLLASAAGVFAQCVAPCENEEGIGMDNCSLFIIEQR